MTEEINVYILVVLEFLGTYEKGKKHAYIFKVEM
jgi:hypothetical protein